MQLAKIPWQAAVTYATPKRRLCHAVIDEEIAFLLLGSQVAALLPEGGINKDR